MTQDAAEALQIGVVAALKASPAMGRLIGGAVFDEVPVNQPHPYVHFGETTVRATPSSGIDAVEIVFTLNGWTRSDGDAATSRGGRAGRALAGALREALHEQDFAVGPEWGLVQCQHLSSNVAQVDDGLITHVTATFRAQIDPA